MKATSNRSGPPSAANPPEAGAAPQTDAAVPGRRFKPTPIDLKQAEMLFSEMAGIANNADRMCYFVHGELIGRRTDSEWVSLELDHLRGVIQQLGWMADLGTAKLQGFADVRGGAEDWLLSPAYVGIAEEVPHG